MTKHIHCMQSTRNHTHYSIMATSNYFLWKNILYNSLHYFYYNLFSIKLFVHQESVSQKNCRSNLVFHPLYKYAPIYNPVKAQMTSCTRSYFFEELYKSININIVCLLLHITSHFCIKYGANSIHHSKFVA